MDEKVTKYYENGIIFNIVHYLYVTKKSREFDIPNEEDIKKKGTKRFQEKIPIKISKNRNKHHQKHKKQIIKNILSV